MTWKKRLEGVGFSRMSRANTHPAWASLLALGVGCVLASASICPPTWLRYGDSCYVMMTQQMTWHEANRSCGQLGAGLAVPNTASEQTFLWELFLTLDPEVGLWMGCNDIAEEGDWRECPLRGGNRSEYENWQSEQPDNAVGADCGVIRVMGKWDDHECGRGRHVACESRLPSPDAPAPGLCLTTGARGRLSSECLAGALLTELPAGGVLSCRGACRASPRCRSFNVLMSPGGGRSTCQLNNATRLEAGEGNMREVNNCYFFDL